MYSHLHNFLMDHYPGERTNYSRALRAATCAYLLEWPPHQVIEVERLKEGKGRKSRVLLLDFTALTEEIAWTHGHLLRDCFFAAKYVNGDRVYHSPQQARIWEEQEKSTRGTINTLASGLVAYSPQVRT